MAHVVIWLLVLSYKITFNSEKFRGREEGVLAPTSSHNPSTSYITLWRGMEESSRPIVHL